MKAADAKAIWWPSSPSPGLMSFGDAWHDDRSGETCTSGAFGMRAKTSNITGM